MYLYHLISLKRKGLEHIWPKYECVDLGGGYLDVAYVFLEIRHD